jgi:hypothetical protein
LRNPSEDRSDDLFGDIFGDLFSSDESSSRVSLHDDELAALLEPEGAEAREALPADAPLTESGRLRWSWSDAGIMAGYLFFALVLYSGLWLDLGHGYLWNSASDQNMWEWFFDVTANNVVHWRNPLNSGFQNTPLGVNMMANTAMLGLGIPLTPITLLFGPTVTWAVTLTGGIAGTAAAWYWVFSRHLVRSRVGAAIGGAFCGFAPSMISHGNAHPNFVAWFVLPFIAVRLIRLLQGRHPVRDGVFLGLLIAYQIFLGEEPMLIFAVTFAVFGIAYLATRYREIPAMLRPAAIGLPIALVLVLVIAGFPLWWQFFGPQSYQSLHHPPAGNDTAAFTRFATQSIAGDPASAADVSINRTEENAFFGWPLIVLMVMVTGWLWRSVVARSIAISMFLMAWLSTGMQLIVAHDKTGFPGPWKWLADKPLFESVVESRFAMGSVFAIGALLALATARVSAAAKDFDSRKLPIRLIWIGAVVAVLLPAAPTKLVVKDRPPTPQFFADGTWQQYVPPGGTVVPVPLPGSGESEPLHWQMDAGLGYTMPEGYFIGPNSPTDKRGRYGAYGRPTSALLQNVEQTGIAPEVSDADRASALTDLRYWHADILVLIPRTNDDALRRTVELLLRKPATFVDGVWIWDVRVLTH